jgi:hypothetical protein
VLGYPDAMSVITRALRFVSETLRRSVAGTEPGGGVWSRVGV